MRRVRTDADSAAIGTQGWLGSYPLVMQSMREERHSGRQPARVYRYGTESRSTASGTHHPCALRCMARCGKTGGQQNTVMQRRMSPQGRHTAGTVVYRADGVRADGAAHYSPSANSLHLLSRALSADQHRQTVRQHKRHIGLFGFRQEHRGNVEFCRKINSALRLNHRSRYAKIK